jgi:quercetin dioxygenase-like cupin family protein
MATVIPLEDIRLSPTASLFQGGDEVAASMFVVNYERGQSVQLHFHPYPEVFVVMDGTGTFTVGDEEVTVAAGHIVVVPPETPHRFRNESDGTLRVVSVHPSGKVIQTDL